MHDETKIVRALIFCTLSSLTSVLVACPLGSLEVEDSDQIGLSALLILSCCGSFTCILYKYRITMAVFHILLRTLSMIFVILLALLLMPHFIRLLIRKKTTFFVFIVSLSVPLCYGQTFPHDSYKSSPIQKLFERQPYGTQYFHEKISLDMFKENAQNKTGFGSLVICVKNNDVLINYLVQSFGGYALCCIVPCDYQSFISRKRQNNLYIDTLMSLIEWPLLQSQHMLDMYLFFLDITLTELQIRPVIIPLMSVISYISYMAEEKKNVSTYNRGHCDKKRKLNKENSTSKQGDSVNAEDNDECDGQQPKKRKLNKHNGAPCGPCTVWLQLGSSPTFSSLHSSKRMFHPNENAAAFSAYLSSHNRQITLREDNCLCQACYIDAHKNANSENNVEPRWVSVHKKAITPEKVRHCPLCHGQEPLLACTCDNVPKWYDYSSWSMDMQLKFWQQYLTYLRQRPTVKLSCSSFLCNKHYMEFYNFNRLKQCDLCEKRCANLTFITHNEKLQSFSSSKKTFELKDAYLTCAKCLTHLEEKKDKSLLERDLGSKLFEINNMAQHVQTAIDTINAKGYMIKKNVMSAFSETIGSNNDESVKKFDNYLSIRLSKYDNIGSYHDNSRFGLIYFQKDIYNEQSIKEVYSLLKDNCQLKEHITDIQKHPAINTRDIQKMIETQTKLFTDGMNSFDARGLFSENNAISDRYILDQFLHPPLVSFLESILNFDSVQSKSNLLLSKTRLKIQAVIAILCNVQNSKCVMLQSVIGLAAYAYGLRDRGFKLLNMFGITCGIDHIRRLATEWSRSRKVTDEIDEKAFWRVTFDNLNFKRKFAKTFAVGGESSGRMLNLLTGQVSHRTETLEKQSENIKQSETLHNSTQIEQVTDDSFFLYDFGDERQAWEQFLDTLLTVEQKRLDSTPGDLKSTLLQDIKNVMPDFTPENPDNVAYATVKTAQSAKTNDVANYLHDLKKDLKIGEQGYPEQVVLGGDQQTYAIVKNLLKKFPSTFSWIVPVPGDWHLLKNAAETLRDLLWDGGLNELAKACGHHKDICQWKDIHNVLCGVHEGLLHEALLAYNGITSRTSFWEWIDESIKCDDEVTHFWASMLRYLHAYVGMYISIRSGNFSLRNACLPILTELFFAYSRDKYEELACQTINDVIQLPVDLKKKFYHGEWILNKTGRRFHSVALDEGHEQIINKRLKELTTRPSEYRTVTLANFMAYLDKFLKLFQESIFTLINPKGNKENVSVNYAQQIYTVLQTKNIFHSEKRVLHNVFSDKPLELENEARHDLLNISKEGKTRMRTYIRQHIIHPPLEVPKKRLRKKMKTFSKRKVTQRTQKSQLGQVCLLLKGAYAQLQKGGQYLEKTIEYPLALCTEFGDLRTRNKSAFKDALQSIGGFEAMFYANLPTPVNSHFEVIIDFLKFLHEPTPPDIATYAELATYLWNTVVLKLGFYRGASCVTVVIDKPEYMPKIRDIIHKERKSKLKASVNHNSHTYQKINISDNLTCLHGTEYTSALQDSVFKTKLIDYITAKFKEKAMEMNNSKTLILDTPYTKSDPILVSAGETRNCSERENEKGEADCGIWFHACCSTSENIVVIANDTDVWMYGLAILESGFLANKQVIIELSNEKEYVHLNNGLLCLKAHPSLQRVAMEQTAAMSLLAVYLLSGSDYLSNFYNLSIKRILDALFKYIDHISSHEEPLIVTEKMEEKTIFKTISSRAYTKLMCCVYLDKYTKLFQHIKQTPPELYESFKIAGNNLTADMKMFLQWLGYPKGAEPQVITISDWAELTRRVCYFSNHGSKNLYRLIIPSDAALNLHKMRGEFIVKLALESPLASSDHYKRPDEYGWKRLGDTLEIMWDENIEITRKQLNRRRPLPKAKCSCRPGRCSIETKGCKNCTKSCKPCTNICLCKGQCNNPHNNGGVCPICPENVKDKTNIESASEESLSERDTCSSGDETEDYEYTGQKDENEDSDLETYFDNNDEYLHIPSVSQTEDYDPELSDYEYLSD